MNEAEVSLHLASLKDKEVPNLLYYHKEDFTSDKDKTGLIIGDEVDIILNIGRPYPPLLRSPAYPEIPKSRKALELHIKELLVPCLIIKLEFCPN
ncbi:hypothetical protein O181_008929 [Austropuccinia psidii MF-1]|uniref:Uncharacterized protein n=1 Tax=Austropuccinia psidii MF-1 TaxID=1389203 RepID=A0A9Q3BND8_9BASI|nr:hypothetical protein [Austropuccinia psidii MF-1]